MTQTRQKVAGKFQRTSIELKVLEKSTRRVGLTASEDGEERWMLTA